MDDGAVLAAYEAELADEAVMQMFVGEMRGTDGGCEIDAITEALLRLWLDLDE